MRTKVIREHFKSIGQMLDIIESRPNNPPMTYHGNDSHSGTLDFTGTSSWDEAIHLFEFGYTDILNRIKKGMDHNVKKTTPMTRRQVTTGVQGYAPHVPNAIMGLPNAMIRTKTDVKKTKMLSIVYSICENCNIPADEFIKSGIAILSVINTLELNGYRVNLDIAFDTATCGEEYVLGTVNVKDHREQLDIQKLCFPIAHPSMFRRIGFKWLETVPHITDHRWNEGYGRAVMWNEYPKEALDTKCHYMGLSTTRKLNYDPDKIIQNMNIVERNESHEN